MGSCRRALSPFFPLFVYHPRYVALVVVVNDLSLERNSGREYYTRVEFTRDSRRSRENAKRGEGKEKKKQRARSRTKVRRRESLRTEFCNRPSSLLTSPVAQARGPRHLSCIARGDYWRASVISGRRNEAWRHDKNRESVVLCRGRALASSRAMLHIKSVVGCIHLSRPTSGQRR